ncbi:uncharacterized protein CEXT_638361 [Caerostris extrusa]|uniref:Ig-like domain-containing protein n=1 Tax=Caerostris extrusa TaxID=172846 RepID=A0AAV4ST99_CAEEX|nr:uncharacterized protein CEXT_638361 [Caerostris extrusa]
MALAIKACLTIKRCRYLPKTVIDLRGFCHLLYITFSKVDLLEKETSRHHLEHLPTKTTQILFSKSIPGHKYLQMSSPSMVNVKNLWNEPSFSISREPGFGLPLLEDMRVSLRCEVDANPPSDPLWVRDDGPLTVTQDSLGFLNFTPVAHQHAGWYRCTTHHEFGFFASFGYFLNVRTAELPVSSDTGNTQLPNGIGQSTNIGCIPDGISDTLGRHALSPQFMKMADKKYSTCLSDKSEEGLFLSMHQTIFSTLRHSL